MLDSIHRLFLLYLHCVAQTQCTEKQFLMHLRWMTNTVLSNVEKRTQTIICGNITLQFLKHLKSNANFDIKMLFNAINISTSVCICTLCNFKKPESLITQGMLTWASGPGDVSIISIPVAQDSTYENTN